jgi:ATP-dependent Clp protease ATP-binding subunit ClpC
MPLKKFDNDFNPDLNEIIYKKSVAYIKDDSNIILPKHIIVALLKEKCSLINEIVTMFQIDRDDLCEEIISIPDDLPKRKKRRKQEDEDQEVFANGVSLDPSSEYILRLADKIVSKFSHMFVDYEHVIFAFLTFSGTTDRHINPVQRALNKYDITEKEFRKKFILLPTVTTGSKEEKENSIDQYIKSNKKDDPFQKFEKAKLNLTSCGYIEDLCEKYKKSHDRFVGRENEISRCVQVLCRKKKRNILVIGESGVGKSALVESIAGKIVEGDIPDKFKKSHIFSVNIGTMLAGTKYRGQFEDRMKNVIAFTEMAKDINQNIILFIDEIHTMVGAGSAEGAINAGDMLKPKLANGEIQCIGATTPSDYRKYFVKDEALSRRFTSVVVEEPTEIETINILTKIKDDYEKYHGVKISDEIIMNIVSLTGRYMKDRHFPDKAIDILDEACAKTVFLNENEVSEKIIEKIISDTTGVPIVSVSGKEKDTLVNLESKIKEKVIGQDKALKIVSNAIKRARIGLKDENKPIGVFLFLGQTGTGKTLTSKTLSEVMFGKDKLIRLDMGEYMEKHSMSKIIGSPPGYVGHDDGSAFVDQVRKKPYSVVLLDEIEKAHVDVLNVFLSIFDEGRMTDSFGRLVDFRNTIIIMTSNLATSKIKKAKPIGFHSQHNEIFMQREVEKFLMEQAKEYFSPEFMNRIDSTVIFEPINRQTIRNIFTNEMEKTTKKLRKIGYSIEVSEEAVDFLCEEGFSETYGARPMARTIYQFVEIPVTGKILEDEEQTGGIVLIGMKDKDLTFEVKKGDVK